MEPTIKSVPLHILNEPISDDLIVFESRDMRVSPHFKIGVLYCARGQTQEEQMFSNEHGSQAFDKFLELLGDEITLQGFNRFPGGLDVKNNSTGEKSRFTTYSGYDIMFHVSTLLPHSDNSQQLHKKRHIGSYSSIVDNLLTF